MSRPEPWDPAGFEEEPPIQVRYGPLEFEDGPETNSMKVSQEVEIQVAPELQLTPEQRELIRNLYAEETAARILALIDQQIKQEPWPRHKMVNQVMIAAKGADPHDSDSWEELGTTTLDGITTGPAWIDEEHQWIAEHKLPTATAKHAGFTFNPSKELRNALFGYDVDELLETTARWLKQGPRAEAPALEVPPAPTFRDRAPRRMGPHRELHTRLRLRWQHH